MSRAIDRFVTQMKLAELRRQRVKLQAAYESLAETASHAATAGEKLRLLSEGLQKIRFADVPLHAEVKHLEILVEAIQAGGMGADVAALWVRTLEQSLAAGRLRSEIVFGFGCLLEEWVSEAPSTAARARTLATCQELAPQLLTAAEPPETGPLFDEIFAALDTDLQRIAPKLEKELHDKSPRMSYALDRIQEDIYQSPQLRAEAKHYSTGDQARDFANAIQLMRAELPSWDWPETALGLEAVWTRNKWRLYVRPDLLTASLLEDVAEQWEAAFDRCIGDDIEAANRRQRLQKLRDLGAPEVIMMNEIRMVQQSAEKISLQSLEITDPWKPFEDEPESSEMETNSIVFERSERQKQARIYRSSEQYAGGYGSTNSSVVLTHAEIQLARAAFPELPIYVVKADLRDFFSSIPHRVLLDILERLHIPAEEREFADRFLRFPVRVNGVDHGRAVRGVPTGFQFSGFLANLLLQFLERYICLKADVRIIREVDDITILSPTAEAAVLAWQRLHTFCEATGLQINEEKCGAVCIGDGELPDELPAQRPTWGMLELNEQGDWGVATAAFEAHLTQAREQVADRQAILSQIQQYNANTRFLLSALAVTADLGDAHRKAIAEAVQRYHLHFLGEGRGIVTALTEEIRRRYFASAEFPIPESWLCWPVTAGGLGLVNPVLELSQYSLKSKPNHEPRTRVPAPDIREPGWNLEDNAWAKFYRGLLEEVAAVPPHETPQTNALVQDFIQRGQTVSGGRQHDLAPYWRWVLSIYGPEILERLGTFRFLITEMVPLQLISQQYLRESSLGGEYADDDEDAED